MKKIYLVITAIAVLSFVYAFENGSGSMNSVFHTMGAPAGYSGDPAGGNKTCNTAGCHSPGPVPQAQTGWITSNIPTTGYVPGSVYTITATATRAGHIKFGFEVSPQSAAGVQLGTMTATSTQTTLVTSATGVAYITHNNTGTAGTGSKTWSFDWTAPTAGSGAVNFYGAFNITNASNTPALDTIYTSVLNVIENTSVGIANRNIALSEINVYPNPAADFVTVKFNPTTKGVLNIQLIDATGRLITNLMNETVTTNELEKHFAISELNIQSGVYYLKFNLNEKTLIKRIMIN